MSIVGVFARPDHPVGYGFLRHGETYGQAHGYVVLFVRCADEEELEKTKQRLSIEAYSRPFYGVEPVQGHYYMYGWLGEWYGGRFDYLATVPDGVEFHNMPFVSLGDNRFVGLYEAKDVLNS